MLSAESSTEWKSLYRVGGAVALICVLLIIIAISIFILWPPPGGLMPKPSTVTDCFKLMRSNWLLGLLDLDLLMVVVAVLTVPIYLALYIALRRASPSFMTIAVVLNFVGVAAYFTVNPAFTMLFLSNQYAAATSDALRSSYVAVGQAILTNYQGTAFDVYYILGAVATLIISAVMQRSNIFGKVTAYVGIVAGVLMLIPANAGIIGMYISLISLVPTLIWYILIARRFFQLGHLGEKELAQQL